MTGSGSELLEQSLRDLEWPRLVAEIAKFAQSDPGRSLALTLGPCGSAEEVRLRKVTLGELLLLAERGAELPVGPVEDVGLVLARIDKGGVPAAAELAFLIGTLRTALDLRRFGLAHKAVAPQLARILEVDPALATLLAVVERAISLEGQILDQASHELAQARSQVRTLRRRVQSRLSDLIGKYRDALQDGYFAEREGRYVLPVRADAPYRVEGFVFGTSQSGSTLYVEPKELAQLGHDLRLAEVEVEKEEARVLSSLATEIRPLVSELGWADELCARADLLAAIVRFSRVTAAVNVPLSERAVIDLKGVRHPLLALAGVPVVKSDLRVGSGEGLVISGPNAGGKTVAIKALGLLTLMQATGLPLPAEEVSEVGFFPLVLADIGDDQSLSQSLSTFSGHVERVREFLAESAPAVLVVLDELMGGTDPGEGAVLAMATLEEMVRRGAAVVVTTHYDALKEFALEQEALGSAAVGFDFERLQPTFRIEMGRPGASSALFVAARHGLPRSVVERAEGLLPEVEARVRRDRIEIEQYRVDLLRQTEELARQRAEQELLNRRLELQIQATKDARIRDLAKESDELRSAVREARAELRSLRARVPASPTTDEVKAAQKSLDLVSRVVALGSDVDRAVRELDVPAAQLELRPGMKVRLKKLRSMGEVLEAPRKGQVRVLMGGLKLSVPLSEVDTEVAQAAPGPKAVRATWPKESLTATGVSQMSVPLRTGDVTLDLRGKRVEGALDELDSFIDELLRRQEAGGFVLHGHGTGAMKDAVRSHLGGHVCVMQSRPAERSEGGDALTIFWLTGA